MSQIKSYVKRNSRLSPAQKAQLLQKDHYVCDQLPVLEYPFIGLEIGFGTGDSLLDVASSHPEQFWIGVEVYEKGVASVVRQALDKNLDNILLRVGDVHDILDQELALGSISHVRIFFPDPWHKKRHHKRRLVNKVFLDKLHALLKSDAVIHFASDNRHYAEACMELVDNHPGFVLSDQILERPLTKFARKAIEKGVEITDIVIHKK